MNIKDIISQSSELQIEVEDLTELAAVELSNKAEKRKVAVWGMLNAGKSSLLNMLTSHINEEFFQTGDYRVTTSVKEFEDEDVIYIDTPGLDANDKDTEEAMRGMRQADVVIFVHQISGELDRQEVDFLTKLVQSFGKYADSNIIIALTKIDGEVENPEKIDQIEQRVIEQCQDIGFAPKVFQISNKRYQKGKKENKQTLIKNSHIVELQQTITQVLDKGDDIQKERNQQEIYERTKDLHFRLQAIKNQLECAIADEKSELAKGVSSFEKFTKEMNRLVDFIHKKDAQMSKIKL